MKSCMGINMHNDTTTSTGSFCMLGKLDCAKAWGGSSLSPEVGTVTLPLCHQHACRVKKCISLKFMPYEGAILIPLCIGVKKCMHVDQFLHERHFDNYNYMLRNLKSADVGQLHGRGTCRLKYSLMQGHTCMRHAGGWSKAMYCTSLVSRPSSRPLTQ